jgi:hypothetical protein
MDGEMREPKQSLTLVHISDLHVGGIVHLPNAPAAPSAQLNRAKLSSSRLEFLSESFAPAQSLLATRGARGTQAVSHLRGERGVELLAGASGSTAHPPSLARATRCNAGRNLDELIEPGDGG